MQTRSELFAIVTLCFTAWGIAPTHAQSQNFGEIIVQHGLFRDADRDAPLTSPATAVETEQELSQVVPAYLDSTVRVADATPAFPIAHGYFPFKPARRASYLSDQTAAWKERLRSREILSPEPGFVFAEPSSTSSSPGPSRQFEGLAASDNVAILGHSGPPPDPNLAVGPSHIMQIQNGVVRISDKFGITISSFRNNELFGGISPYDARIIYDAPSGRWFASAVEYDLVSSVSSAVVAVSMTSDPTGMFCRYRLGNPTTTDFIQDFAILGVSGDKVVVTYHGATFSFALVGDGYYVLNKDDMTTCSSTVRMTRADPDLQQNVIYPVHSLSGTSDLYMVTHTGTLGLNRLRLFTVSGVPGVSAVSVTTRTLIIRQWSAPPDAPQSGSSVLFKTGGHHVLSASWQNQSLWLAGHEACTPPGDTATRACLRIIEARTDDGSIRQDMTVGASGYYYYYPALRPDAAGNVQLVFSSSSETSFASVRAASRGAADPVNTIRPSIEIRAGGGASTHPSGRYGDYAGAAVDPSDPFGIWVIAEYIKTTAEADWGMYVAEFQFPSQAPPPFIARMVPRSGPVGADVTLSGSGFTPLGNTVRFGPGYLEGLESRDGSALSFTVPDGYNLPYAGAFPPVQPGPHEVRVVNANGTSNSVVFTVIER